MKPPHFPNWNTDEEMGNFRDSMKPEIYNSIVAAYKILWGFPDHIVPDTEIDGVPFLIERNFT